MSALPPRAAEKRDVPGSSSRGSCDRTHLQQDLDGGPFRLLAKPCATLPKSGTDSKLNTVHLSTLIAFLISIGDSGLFVRRRSGKLLILRLTPRELRRLRLETTRSCRISSRTAL